MDLNLFNDLMRIKRFCKCHWFTGWLFADYECLNYPRSSFKVLTWVKRTNLKLPLWKSFRVEWLDYKVIKLKKTQFHIMSTYRHVRVGSDIRFGDRVNQLQKRAETQKL